MFEWSEQHRMIRDAVRRFVEAEIKPNLEQLEHGDMPPYDVLRKLISTFGMDEMARARFQKQIAREKAQAAAGEPAAEPEREAGGRGDAVAMQLIPIIELCRYCPGHGDGDGREHGAHGGGHPVEGHDAAEGALGARSAHARRRSAPGRSPSPARARTRSAA